MAKDSGKLTKDQANKIGNFTDENGVMFTPFCQEMTDGTYLILRSSWENYKERKEFEGIKEPEWFEESELKFKLPKNIK